jgi:5'-nucleotidase
LCGYGRNVRVLVTNDDGVESPGVHALATAIAALGHDVVVVAPSGERSGSGAAIGRLHRGGPVAWTEVDWPDLPHVAVHSVDLPPAATVYAGCLGAFGAKPDVVASGVNPGLNYGHLVLHSGTVGAALTASVLGVPAIAVSVAWGEHSEFATAATLAAAALEWTAAPQPVPRVVNLNVPNVPLADVRGVRAAATASFNEEWKAETRPGELALEYVGRLRDVEAGTDLAAVHDGYAAVTLLTKIGSETAAPGLAEAVAQALS